jgi:hypothetical protein
MKATLLLADYADIANGKLGVLGGGVTWFYAHSSVPLSVAVLVEADPGEAGKNHDIALRIVNLAGDPVGFTGDDGKPYRYEIEDVISWPERPAVENDLDYIWVGRWFGINLDSGVYRLEFVVNSAVVGMQSVTVRAREE